MNALRKQYCHDFPLETLHAVKTCTLTSGTIGYEWLRCAMPPSTIITLSAVTRRPQRHQKTSLSLTQGSLQSWSCVVWRLWVKAGESHDWVQCSLLDGWQSGSEVHFPPSSVTLSGLALRGSKKRFDEEDSEAPRHLAAAAALPSTSWGPAELLCGGQRRETRCTLWSKDRLRGAVQVTPSVGVCHRDAHCEEEKGGGGEMWCNCKFTQNKRVWINKIRPACVHKTPKLSSSKWLVSDCNTVNHMGGFHTLIDCQMLSHWHQSTVHLLVHALAHTNLIILYTSGLSVHRDECAPHCS